MKKLSFLALSALGVMMATSCSQEDVVAPNPDGNVQITISLPEELATRAAIGSGLDAVNLSYAIYEVDGDGDNATYTKVFAATEPGFFANGLSNTLSFDLLKGRNYKVAFFAQSEASADVYTFDADSQTISVVYSKMTQDNNYSDAYDCFLNTWSPQSTVQGQITDKVVLTRPVAQLNWGSNDLTTQMVQEAYGTEAANLVSSVTIKDAPVSLNFLTGATTTSESVEIGTFGKPGGNLLPGYTYVGMQYVLTPQTSTNYDVTLNVANAATDPTLTFALPVSNVPLQANYQTNIYGSLLTNSSDLTISMAPSFNQTEYNYVWDGESVTIPQIVNNTITINQAAELAGLAAMVSGGNDLSGVTINLNSSLDMGGYPFPGIGSASRSSSSVVTGSTPFRGKFNGNGKTLSNVYITGTLNGDNAIGFIPNLDGANAELSNVIFTDLTINAINNDQAGVVALVTNGASVSGVTVQSGSVTSYEAAGGIVGRILSEGSVTNCNNYATITAEHYHAAGIVGAAYYPLEGKSMTIQECNNYGKIICNGETKDWGMETAGGIVGYSCADVIKCINEGDIDSGVSPTGGIAGWHTKAGSIISCTNKGNVSGGCLVGGIAGLVDTETEGSVVIANNTNEGSVTGIGRYGSQNGGVGGIIGSCGVYIICYGNTNSAPSLNGGSSDGTGNYVAGIMGQANTAYQAETGPYVKNNTNNTSLDNMTGNPKAALYNGKTLEYTGTTN